MKSGNLTKETVGSGTDFGPHAVVTTSATKMSFRIQKSLHRRGPFGSAEAKLSEQAARNIGNDRDVAVPRFVNEHAAVPIQTGDLLAIGGIIGVERQRDATHIQRKARRQRVDQLGDAFATHRRNQERSRLLL